MLTFDEIVKLLQAKVIFNGSQSCPQIEFGCASDLMSDVLTVCHSDKTVLLTGLSNPQTLRTAEMADIQFVIILRGKSISKEMEKLAIENNISLAKSDLSMLQASGILYNSGLKSLF